MPGALLAAAAVLATALAAASPLHAGAAATHACPPRPPVTERPITAARWISGAVVTEYYPIRERWFRGRRVAAPGLPGRHRADWLYGPHGVAMNGEGLGGDGRFYHFAGPYDVGWVNAAGRTTEPCWDGAWTAGEPAWLDLGWRNARGRVTFPLSSGGWSDGRGVRYLPPPGIRFAPGRSSALPFWKTVAVDPRVVPRGSRVFIAAYCDTPAHGWFRALDTGGAIIGFHFDVYRPPPVKLELHALRRQHVYVLPPGATPRRRPPTC